MIPDGLVYTYERVIYPQPTVVADSFSYSYEQVDVNPASLISQPDALVYSYERVRYSPLVPVADGIAYSFNNVASAATPNPTQVKVWDGTQWVVKPVYVWDGTNWVQAY